MCWILKIIKHGQPQALDGVLSNPRDRSEYKHVYHVEKYEVRQGMWLPEGAFDVNHGNGCWSVPNFLCELWLTTTAAAIDQTTWTHFLLFVKHCLQDPRAETFLSNFQLQRKKKDLFWWLYLMYVTVQVREKERENWEQKCTMFL